MAETVVIIMVMVIELMMEEGTRAMEMVMALTTIPAAAINMDFTKTKRIETMITIMITGMMIK